MCKQPRSDYTAGLFCILDKIKRFCMFSLFSVFAIIILLGIIGLVLLVLVLGSVYEVSPKTGKRLYLERQVA